jgi:hypothetical protein
MEAARVVLSELRLQWKSAAFAQVHLGGLSDFL